MNEAGRIRSLESRAKDEIHVDFGNKYSYALRRHGVTSELHHLVGQAYVHSITQGETVKE